MELLKVQLWNKNLGTLDVTPDPIGLNETEHILKRSSDAHGVFQEISLEMEFIKRSKAFIQSVYETEGIQGVIIVNMFRYDSNAFKMKPYYTGKIALKRYVSTKTGIKTHIDQTGFEVKVASLVDVDVDMDALLSQGGVGIPATTLEAILFHAKKIIKESVKKPTDGNEFQQIGVYGLTFPDVPPLGPDTSSFDVISIGQFDDGQVIGDELTESFSTPYGWAVVPPPEFGSYIPAGPGTEAGYIDFLELHKDRNPKRIAREAGVMSVNLTLAYKHEVEAVNTGGDVDVDGCGSSSLGHVEIWSWFEHRNTLDEIISIEKIGEWDMSGCGSDIRAGDFETKNFVRTGINVAVGDKFYVYETVRIYGDYEHPTIPDGDGNVSHAFRIQADVELTDFTFVQETVFPEQLVSCYMVFEALKKCAQYMTDQVIAFKSTFFGRTDTVPSYPVDGPGSLIAITNGGKIRQLPDTKVFIKWSEIIESLSARHCLGWGFERDAEGKQSIVVEELPYFYNKDSMIMDVGCVSDLEKIVSVKHYNNQVEFGFPKLDIGQFNGLDEFNTMRRDTTPITEINSKLTITSKYKTSGFEIESQRRLFGSTKDSRLDQLNFMVNVIRDGLGFKSARNENYPVVENLYDPDSAYNLYFAPGRGVRTWLKVLASNVTKLADKILKFTYGDGNFKLVSRETSEPEPIAEDEDIDMTDVEPLWENEIYKFDCPLDATGMDLIRANPYGYIRFKDHLGNVKDGYVMEVRHDPAQGMGEFELLKVYRNPVE
jgi:hypothetical protein